LLLEIFPFIFPQYTHFIREYNFKIEGNSQKKEDIPDFLAATANLSVDILEIKTPYFDLFRKGKYRGNFVFSSEVQGLISQAQKYIYNLERNALREEPKITKKFQKETDFKGEHLYIRSPKAIVIVGKNP
ncbi:Shedu anti-phage system protein SduA domain-containing protein, partial [Lactococcus lactis]